MGISSFAPDASPADLREAFSRDGAFVLSDVLDRERLTTLREALRPLITNAPLGANSFDGFKTRRVFDPLARTRSLDDLVLNPVVQRAIQDLLPACYQLGMTVLSEVQPGEVAQKLHRDAAVYPLPSDFPEVMVNTIWALDAFTSANGATVIVAGSHRDPSARDQEPAVMSPGSVLVLRASPSQGRPQLQCRPPARSDRGARRPLATAGRVPSPGGGTRSRRHVARGPPGTARLQPGQRLLRLHRRPVAP